MALLLSVLAQASAAAPPPRKADPVAIGFFCLFILVTLGITYWAAKRTRTAKEFYAAGRSISGAQNGLALAGDYMSAASFLGIAGMVATRGYDGLIYSVGFLVGWPICMFLIAEPLRNLGKYTFADVVAYRLSPRPIRTAAATGAIVTVLTYLTAQMVGAGDLVNLLLPGLNPTIAIVAVGIIMLLYVLFGGMLATTWVQIIKAVLLIGGATALVLMILWKFSFNYGELFGRAAEMYGDKFLIPGGFVTDKLDTISLGVALMFGTAGLPHILMRFYTVPDAKEARKSVFYATGWIGYFYILTFTIGFGAAVLVGPDRIKLEGGANMSAPLLAETLGGPAFFGFLGAVAFATILAVVAGLTLAGASALSHDIWVGVVRRGHSDEREQVLVARIATIVLGILAILLGILLKGQNVAFLVGLAFALAASANFPSLVLSILWKRFTTRGAVASTWTGIVVWLVLTVLSPTVWVGIFKNKDAIFPLKSPGLFSMGAAFLAGIVFSLLKREPSAEEKFEEEKLRSYVGIGAD